MDKNINKKISVIGGNGFLGSELLSVMRDKNIKNFDVNNLTEEDSYLDVENIDSMDQLDGSSVVINLAAIHRDDVRPISRYDEVNVNGAKNVCDICEKYNINKIIFTSSVAIYGFAPPNTDESGMPNYFNDYGRTKYEAEEIYKKWYLKDTLNRSLVIIRPTVIFGEGNRGNVYNLLNSICSNKFLMIGSGKNKKSMAYVKNVAAFIRYSIDFDQGIHIYNYIDKPDIDMNTLVSLTRSKVMKKKGVGLRIPYFIGVLFGHLIDIFSKIMSKNFPISYIRVKKFASTTQFNTSISKTRFQAPYSLEEGLINTLNYEFLDDNKDKQVFFTE